MYYYGLDPTFIILIPAIIISIYVQLKIKSTFSKYSQVRSERGYTASQVARYLLDRAGLYDVGIEMIGGNLTDHYDPSVRVLRLSQTVYNSDSVAAIGIAAHETGHAMQHEDKYAPLIIRNKLVPVANFGSNASWVLILLSFITGINSLMQVGIILFSAAVLFQVITLPVELNASGRAVRLLQSEGILYSDEVEPVKRVLRAAAMTYVAAMLTAMAQLLRLLVINRRRND